MYFPQKKNFNAEQSFSTPFSVFRNASNQFCIMTFVPTSCEGHLPDGYECISGVFFRAQIVCQQRCAYMISIQPCMIGLPIQYFRCLIAHLCGLLVMHGGNSFNIRGKDVSTKVIMLKELPPCITSSPHRCAIRHL